MGVRYARADDHAAIDEVVSLAFGRADEVALVRRLRAGEDRLFELVAEEDGQIVGHIFFSRLWADSPQLFAALAPLAVRPHLQRSGVGSRLVKASLECAKEFGCHGLLVLGDPDYYGRFGFSAQAASLVRAPFSGLAAFQALALEAGAFDAAMIVAYPDAFNDESGTPI